MEGKEKSYLLIWVELKQIFVIYLFNLSLVSDKTEKHFCSVKCSQNDVHVMRRYNKMENWNILLVSHRVSC